MDSCKCPITGEIFEDPVVGDDGHTYERNAITDWLARNQTSPITREPMDVNSLRTNYAVKKMIEEFQTTEQSHQTQFQLDVDIRKTRPKPLFQGFGKFIYEVEWINRKGPPIILMKIEGAKAKREASFYVQLSCHPHIVRTFGLVQSNPGSVMLLQEAAPHGDLSEHLRENGFKPNEQVLWEIFNQVCDAMICLADNAIVHGDLACRNVLVFYSNSAKPTENLVKLTDFGLTKASSVYAVVDSPAMTTMTTIPVRYAAPEILREPAKTSNSEKSDVYSMGVLMWEACSYGQLPYSELETDNQVRKQKLSDYRLAKPTLCSTLLWKAMNDCWQQGPSDRPTFKRLRELLSHHHTKSAVNSSEKTSSNGRKTDHVSSSTNNDTNTDMTRIPCEFCGEIILGLSNWSIHTNSCQAEEESRIESLRKQISQAEITARIPCEFCHQLYTVDQLEKHQKSCRVIQTPTNLQRDAHYFQAPKFTDQQSNFTHLIGNSDQQTVTTKLNQSSEAKKQRKKLLMHSLELSTSNPTLNDNEQQQLQYTMKHSVPLPTPYSNDNHQQQQQQQQYPLKYSMPLLDPYSDNKQQQQQPQNPFKGSIPLPNPYSNDNHQQQQQQRQYSLKHSMPLLNPYSDNNQQQQLQNPLYRSIPLLNPYFGINDRRQQPK